MHTAKYTEALANFFLWPPRTPK